MLFGEVPRDPIGGRSVKGHATHHANTHSNIRRSDSAHVEVIDIPEQKGKGSKEEVEYCVYERVVQAE